MSETQTIAIGDRGYKYAMRHADALDTLQVAARLGNASAALFEGLAHGKGAGRMAGAAMYLLSSPQLGPTLDFVVRTFAPCTQIITPDGRTADLGKCVGEHFAGHLSDFSKWIEAVVEWECGDFLGEMAGRFLAALEEAMKEASPSPSPPPGPTG